MKIAAETWIANLQNAMRFLDGLEIDERHRATLRRACASALVEAEDNLEFDYEHRNSSEKWKKDDIELLEKTLASAPLCVSWGEEGLILDSLIQRLGRTKKNIKKKAIELGHGKKVDYWANRK